MAVSAATQRTADLPNVTVRCLPNPETLSQFASTSLYIPQPSSYTFADLFEDLSVGFRNIGDNGNLSSFASAIALGRFEGEQSRFTVVTREDPATLVAPVTPGVYYIFRHEQRLCAWGTAGSWNRIPQHPPALAGEAHCCRHVALLTKKSTQPSIVVSDENTQRQPLRICTSFTNLGVLPDIEIESNSVIPDFSAAANSDPRSSAFLSAISARDESCLLTGDSCFEAANIVPFHNENLWTSDMQNAAWMERNRIGFAQTHEYGPEEITSFCVENGFAVHPTLRRDFDRFLWSVNPKTFRIRVFSSSPHLLPFHDQPILRNSSYISPRSSAFPPAAVWRWHYQQCVLRCLHNPNALYTSPAVDGLSFFNDCDSAIADEDSSDEEEDCLCFSPSSGFGDTLEPVAYSPCPQHQNRGIHRHRTTLSVSSSGGVGISRRNVHGMSKNDISHGTYTEKRALTWDSSFSEGKNQDFEQTDLVVSVKRTRL